jgi:hypothetical protein
MNRIKLCVAAFALLTMVASCDKDDDSKKAEIERLTELSNPLTMFLRVMSAQLLILLFA